MLRGFRYVSMIVAAATPTKETLNENKEEVNITATDTKAWTSAFR